MGPGQDGPPGRRRGGGGLTLDIPAITAGESTEEDADGANQAKDKNESSCKEDKSESVSLSPLSDTNMVSGLGERLVVVETIGRGNSGTVSLAIDACEGAAVAVKTISLLDADHRSMLKHEMDALRTQRLQLAKRQHGTSGSPYIVDFYGAYFSDDENAACIVVEYMPYGNLQQWVDSTKSMPEEWLSQVAFEVLSALVYLHERNQVHRDVKPGNILISRNGNIKLSDFGITRELKDKGCTSFVGTFNYMSPERLTGEAYSYNSDVWSLGMCLATCVLGQCPFPPDQSFWQLLQQLEVPLQMLGSKSMSPDMRDFVSQCLIRDPKTRPQAADLTQHPFLARREAWGASKWTDISASMASMAGTLRNSPGGIANLVEKVDARRQRLAERSLREDPAAATALAEQLGIDVALFRDAARSDPMPTLDQASAEGNRRRLSFAHMKAPWAPQNALSGCAPRGGEVTTAPATTSGTLGSYGTAALDSNLPSLNTSSTVPLWRAHVGGNGAVDIVSAAAAVTGAEQEESEEMTFGIRRKIVPGTRSDFPWSSLPQQDSPSSGGAGTASDKGRRALRHSFGEERMELRRQVVKSSSQSLLSVKSGARRGRSLTDGGPPPGSDGSAMLASCSMLRAITGHSARATTSAEFPALLASRVTPTATSARRRLPQLSGASPRTGAAGEAVAGGAATREPRAVTSAIAPRYSFNDVEEPAPSTRSVRKTL